MAVTALNLSTVRTYVCKDDTENPTIWKLGALSARDRVILKDAATSVYIETVDTKSEDGNDATKGERVNTTINRSKMLFEACRRAIKGWENLLDANGDLISYVAHTRDIDGKPREVVVAELLDRIPFDTLMELGAEILGDNPAKVEALGN